MESPIELLPYDIINCIFKFVTNKISLNRTCIFFNQQLKKLFDDGQLINYNDPYFLSKYYNEENILEITKHINQITDPKNLNYVCVMFNKDYTLDYDTHCQLGDKLLQQYCIIHDPNLDRLCILLNHFKKWLGYCKYYIPVMQIIIFAFNKSIKHKSYRVAFLIMKYFDYLDNIWLKSASKRMSDKDEWDNILNEIKYVPRDIVQFDSILHVLTGGIKLDLDCDLARYLNSYLDCYGYRTGRY
jgi:hypothetical protein